MLVRGVRHLRSKKGSRQRNGSERERRESLVTYRMGSTAVACR